MASSSKKCFNLSNPKDIELIHELLENGDFLSSDDEVGDPSFELESVHSSDSEQEIVDADLVHRENESVPQVSNV